MLSKLDLYRIFDAVAQNSSFSQAAKQLYLTQPAVSQSIMQLENELAVRLFKRTSKGVTLTQEGTLLYDYVHSAIHLIESGENKVQELKTLTAGTITIGVGDTISRYYLLPYLENFHRRYPDIKFKLINGTTSELCTILKTGQIDIAICNFPIEDDKLELIPCQEIQDTFVCGEQYKKDFTNPISLTELVKYPLICLDNASISRQFIDEFMESHGIQLVPEFELGAHDLLLDFAKINLGIACVTREFAADYLKDGSLTEIQLTEQIPKRSIGICYLKSVPLNTASLKFIAGMASPL
ncbi:LysR family transcriptional regulator [Enterococcus saccharolyticus]|uniref:LysR family transcriptional regulator n=1 Tax=Enterococcus saccharolyticus TaxID=41997 RepID=UPI001E3DFA54|nr:LysR family transcriptional regulator [Enterococcus saccharolyticus]MCD5002196.1 LysR family transcriptional regulator [Enterococcus saccharolyticus]